MTPFKMWALSVISALVSCIVILILYGYCKTKFRGQSEPIHNEEDEEVQQVEVPSSHIMSIEQGEPQQSNPRPLTPKEQCEEKKAQPVHPKRSEKPSRFGEGI